MYKYYTSNIQDILNKYEFLGNSGDKKKTSGYKEPHQLLLQNYISKHTPYENILLFHGLGTGKCHAKNTAIIMHNGDTKKVQDIKTGEMLMGDDGSPRNVLSLARGQDTMYKIKQQNGDEYTVNSEHILCLKPRTGLYPKIQTDYTENKYKLFWIEDNGINIREYQFSDLDICRKDLQTLKYLQDNDNSDSLDRNILHITVKDFIKLQPNIREDFLGYKSVVEFTHRDVTDIDRYWDASGIRDIPDIYKYNSVKTRMNTLRCILKSCDVMYDKHCITAILDNNDAKFKTDLKFLLDSLSLVYKFRTGDDYTYLYIQTDTKLKLCNDSVLSHISIEQLGTDEYYGFVLSGNRRYLLGDFTVTHNTCAAISIAEGFKEYVSDMGKKIVVLVKNRNIQRNFLNELMSKCTGNTYSEETYDEDTENPLASRQDLENKIDTGRKISKLINNTYNFITYGTFVNRVLGMKEYKIDETGSITSKSKVTRKITTNLISDLSNTVIIVDEAHNITNNDVYIALHSVLSKSYNYRLVLLTATPMYDNPKEIFEISNLLNINEPEKQLPIRNELFRSGYLKKRYDLGDNKILKGGIIEITDFGLQEIKKNLKNKVSYIGENTETNPKKIEIGDKITEDLQTRVVFCEMSDYQYSVYKEALSLDLGETDYDITEELEKIGEMESQDNIEKTQDTFRSSSLYKNTSDASTFVYDNGKFGKVGFLETFKQIDGDFKVDEKYKKMLQMDGDLKTHSSKLYNLLKNIQDDEGTSFVYSNYVSYGGTSLIRQILLYNGYSEFSFYKGNLQNDKTFVVLDDNKSIETRERIRKIFNSYENRNGKIIKVLVGSPVVSEGITFKNTRAVHILEPSWNMSRINQIVGRAIRNYSHHDLDEQDRYVKVYKYVSIQDDNSGFFIDKEKYILSEQKDRSNKRVERLLKINSFDCDLMVSRNINKFGEAGSPECDYTKCHYTCADKLNVNTNKQREVDRSTYNLYINDFENADIKLVKEILSDLFRVYFVWKLSDIVDRIHEIEPLVSQETIYTVLGNIVDSKETFVDMYNRSGFILNRGNYYVFNPIGLDISSSLYDKILNFSVDKNIYTLGEYLISDWNVDLFEKLQVDKKLENLKTDKMEEKNIITEQIVETNRDIIKSNDVFGTYRKRPKINEEFGEWDGKFRIVDLRKQTNKDEDFRKSISGMWIGSYKKSQLLDIAKYLQIVSKKNLKEYDKMQLGEMIQENLTVSNKVLK
jgi:superfamily II DNA or RNA helicase